MGTVLPNFPASPISEVQPFTYRDNESYLKQLSRLRDYVRENLQRLNNQEIVDVSYLLKSINDLSASFNAQIDTLEASIAAYTGLGEYTAFDPTNGLNTENLSMVLGNVYDNVRIFAYFAVDYDNLNMTALEYDNYLATMPVRQMDLAPLYPTLNAALKGS